MILKHWKASMNPTLSVVECLKSNLHHVRSLSSQQLVTCALCGSSLVWRGAMRHKVRVRVWGSLHVVVAWRDEARQCGCVSFINKNMNYKKIHWPDWSSSSHKLRLAHFQLDGLHQCCDRLFVCHLHLPDQCPSQLLMNNQWPKSCLHLRQHVSPSTTNNENGVMMGLPTCWQMSYTHHSCRLDHQQEWWTRLKVDHCVPAQLFD